MPELPKNKYIIIAESGADLSPDMIERYDIRVLPMHIALGNNDYNDGAVSIEDIIAYYNSTGAVPKTSAVNPYDYQQAYERIAAENPEAVIIHICYSAQTTASFQNARIADEGLNRTYHIDSKNVSIGQAYIVMKAIELIESAPEITPEELVKQIVIFANTVKFYFIPGNLAYLRAGGRVSNAQYLGAAILGLRPLIELIEGKLVSTKKYRGSKKKAILSMINDFFSSANIDKTKIYLGHVGDLDDDIRQCVDKNMAERGVKESVWHKAGAVITSHAGPGGFGIAGIAV